jgi:hypothetical protein
LTPLLTGLLTGLGLAAASGLNAWAVLLLFQGLVRLLPQEFPGGVTAALSSPFVLDLAIVLFLLEFIVDKIPFIDRIWEALNSLLRPAIGALLALACVPVSGLAARALVVVAAVAVSFAAHAAQITTRLTSTAATQGWTQVALSLVEDIVAIVLAILLFFQPWLTLVVLAALALVLLTHWARVQRALGVLFFRLQHPRRGNL